MKVALQSRRSKNIVALFFNENMMHLTFWNKISCSNTECEMFFIVSDKNLKWISFKASMTKRIYFERLESNIPKSAIAVSRWPNWIYQVLIDKRRCVIVYEFYKKHKDSGDSKGIVDNFFKSFWSQDCGRLSHRVNNKIKSVYPYYP